MKLGYLTPLSLESIATARRLGYDAIEAGAGWLTGSTLAEIEADLPRLRDALQEHGVAVTAVAIYGGTLDAPVAEAVAYWGRAMAVAKALGCHVVAGLTGRDNSLTVDDNLPLFRERFGPIARRAEDEGVRLALEPWPGGVQGHGPYRWTNLASTPELWDRLFTEVPSPALGLEYDPSHLVWQGIDYLRAILDYGDRIHHVHAKDIVIDRARLARVGVHGQGWWRFVVPGLGEVDWLGALRHLRLVGYAGDMAFEHEDRVYLNERWEEGLCLGLRFLRSLVAAY
jgi:sugar phosphate isomerase/epimerase